MKNVTTEINDIDITVEMTPDGLTKLLVEKFGGTK